MQKVVASLADAAGVPAACLTSHCLTVQRWALEGCALTYNHLSATVYPQCTDRLPRR